ncbi:MAG TPA: aminopeptidase P family protein, partial [Phycisphaerae bacterium]
MKSIIIEKVEQAVGILNEFGVDAWLTFVRETTESGDTVLPLILGQNLTWQSALLITRSGQRIAIVGNYEADAVKATGAWSEVVPYVQGIRTALIETLQRIDPKSIAINYSRDDVKADGLSHGMFLLLHDHLADTSYRDRLVGADQIINALRGRKTAGEVARIRRAIQTTDEIFRAIPEFARLWRSELEIAEYVRRLAAERRVGLAW